MANGKREAMGKGIRALLSDIGETPNTSSVGSLSADQIALEKFLTFQSLRSR